MSTELDTVEKRLANQVGKFTSEEIAIIKNTVAKGTTDLELAYFLNVAASYGFIGDMGPTDVARSDVPASYCPGCDVDL